MAGVEALCDRHQGRLMGFARAQPILRCRDSILPASPLLGTPGACTRPTPSRPSLLKIASALIFAVMAALVRYLGAAYPVGQVVFFRSAFAIVPVVVIYAWRARARGRHPHGPAVRPCGARAHRHRRHVLQFLGAGAAADRRCDRDLVCGAAHHRGDGGAAAQGAGAHLSLVGGHRRLHRRHGDAGAASRAARRRRSAGDAVGGRLWARRRVLQRALDHPDASSHQERDHLVDRVLLLADLHRSPASSPGRSAGTRRAGASLRR